MPRVRFLPRDVTVAIERGRFIHEAAILAGLHDLELPCGGEGTCGQCLVETGGELVPACQTKVTRDLEVIIPERASATALRVVGDSHFLLSEDRLPDRKRLTPLYRVERLTLAAPSIEEHYSDWARLVRALGGGAVEAGLAVLRGLAEAVRADEGRVTVELFERNGAKVIAQVRAGHGAAGVPVLGLAVDIGTTTVALQLVDLETGRVLDTRTTYNQQLTRGADIITRIDYARTPERLGELRALVLGTINGLIHETAAPAADIRAVFVAGNTTMIHLLLGLPPKYIRESPYVPTVNPAPPLDATAVGLEINPEAVVECAPGVGSYVGGDITAGLLATDLISNHDDVFLFLDIGTNGEIVIGNADWMVGCACSAGPAFEGAGINCGMRASDGAIERVEIAADRRTVRCEVVGGGAAKGICGSGLICLLGELFARGLVDAAGHINADPENPRLVMSGNRRGYEVAPGIVINEGDIENLIRTKAAIYAACALVLENVGLDWTAISRVYIAGGFGRYIRISDAVLIGMLPDLEPARFRYLGNSALTGAYIALLSREHRAKLGEIAGRMTYVDLSSDPRYMDAYVQAMFLPHTDLARFPSVEARTRAAP
jgi:uncharacterized 2Fe-2S/4Fe-4S cluster protein (DUF4445 family)